MNYKNELIEALFQLGKRDQRIGQVFENIRNNVSNFKYQSNEEVLNTFKSYINTTKPTESLREGTRQALVELEFLLRKNISIAFIIEKLKEGNRDLFHYNNFEISKLLSDISLQLNGLKKIAPYLLTQYYFYEELFNKDSERRKMAKEIGGLAIEMNEYLTNDYLDFYNSRAYFVDKREVKNFNEDYLIEVVERVSSKIISNEQVSTLDIYILQKDFSKNKKF